MNIIKRINWKSLKAFALSHKALSALVVIAVFSAGYGTLRAKSSTGVTHYILGTVARGTISTTVSGTGDVQAAEQMDVKAKASGDILSVSVHTGQAVHQGDLLASIDPGDASISLQTAELSYDKLIEPTDTSTLISAKQAVNDAQTGGEKAYADAENETASTFLDLPAIFDGMNALFYTNGGYLSDQTITSLGSTAASYRSQAGVKLDTAKREYDDLSALYKGVNLNSSTSTFDELFTRTTSTLTDLMDALKQASVAVQYVKNISSGSPDPATVKQAQALGASAQSSLSGWTTQVQSHLTGLVADQTAIENAPATLASKQAALDKLEQGADPLDVQSAALSLQSKRNDYNDYFVTAPFDGIVGKLDVKKGDSLSSGSIVATLVTTDEVAEVSLNEVDAAKVKVGDKANLTFDAVDGLSLVGTVSDIDLVGTVTQGVVTYNAKIVFDTNDPRVLPGMSVSADIITEAKTDVLTVPSSAVKTDAEGSYVLAFTPALSNTGGATGVVSATPPTEVSVQTGLTSDTNVEILSGLSEGEQIVVRTITPSSATAAAAQPSLFGGAGGGRPAGGGGGAARALGR